MAAIYQQARAEEDRQALGQHYTVIATAAGGTTVTAENLAKVRVENHVNSGCVSYERDSKAL